MKHLMLKARNYLILKIMYNVGFLVDRFYPMQGGAEVASYLLANKLQELDQVNIFAHCSSKMKSKINYNYPLVSSRSYSFLTSFVNSRNRIKMCKENKVNILHGMMLHGAAFSSIKLKKKLNGSTLILNLYMA